MDGVKRARSTLYEKVNQLASDQGIEASQRLMADMAAASSRSLRIFLCHASSDKPAVRDLYRRLQLDGFDPWLDEDDLMAGQDWEREISYALRAANVVIVCLSRTSITKEGYVQKEIRQALDVADEKPEGTIFLVPTKLEECDVPNRLRRWHWVDLFEANGYEKLLRALRLRTGVPLKKGL
jgi:hypothetical protein